MKRRSLVAALAAVLLSSFLLAAQAGAAPVTGGNADWGIKQSFRNYVVNGPAAGSITPSEGATTNPGGTFDWQPGSGTYEPGASKVNATFGGKVFFSGHAGILKFTLSKPRLEYTGETGVLYADVVSSEPFGPTAGQEKQYPNVDFATLDLSAATKADDGSKLTVSGIKATLTENGAAAFAGFYDPGTALDDVAFEFTYDASAPAAEVRAGKRTAKVASGGGSIKLATIDCKSTTCKVKAPKSVTAKIKGGDSAGKKVKAKLKVPKGLAAGESGDIVAQLTAGSAKKLAGGKSLKLAAEVTVTGDGQPVTKKLKVKAVPK